MMSKTECEQIFPKNEDGYCEWINPRKRGYLLQCCDCGLVHAFDFDAVQFESATSNKYVVLEGDNYGVVMRCKRLSDEGVN
jgi:uncharacterized Zn finger protein